MLKLCKITKCYKYKKKTKKKKTEYEKRIINSRSLLAALISNKQKNKQQQH